MADKIDQLKIGDASYDIDLPPDATPSIASLAVSGAISEGGTSLANKYLGKSAKAADSSKLNGQAASYYAKASDIPTVNNATLTIQKNGTNVQTFTANQSSNVTANITVPTTYSDVGAAAAHHLYHTWDNNTNYYDSYEGGKMFRIVTENMYADCFRFQASTVSNLEYYNGSSWVSWNFDLSNLFDGNARTSVAIPYNNRKFRFQLTANGGWPTTALFMLQGTWFSDGGWPNGQKSSIIIETRANTSADWSQKASFDLSGVEGMAGHTLSSLHTGQTLYRITIEIAPWKNTSNACTLTRLCLFSNYNGGALEKITHDGYGNVTIPTLKSTTIYENGTALSSKYQKALPTTTTEGKVLKSTTTAGTVEWADDTNTNQTIKVGTTTFGANDVVGLVAGANIDSITADASAKTITINAKDTTYSSKTAASGGTDVSLVTTGEKYTWNNKSDLTIGTTSTTAAAGNHAHGNITNSGTITSTAVTSATGVLVYDSNNKIQRATAAQTRSIIGAGTSNFSGSYNDLTNRPTIPATNVIPTTTTANKVLVSTTTSGTAKWSDFSSAGFLKTNTSGVVSVDTNSYLTTSGKAADSDKLDGQDSTYYLNYNNLTGTPIPGDSGEIKTKYRCALKGDTGSGNPVWYYKLVKLPKDDSGNYASAIIKGRIGGWTASGMSAIYCLVWNRDGVGLSLLDLGGTGTMSTIFDTADLVVYKNSDNTADIYIKCKGYFTFDLDVEVYQSTASITYDGTYITTTPSGTESGKASTSTSRLELEKGVLKVNGTDIGYKILESLRKGSEADTAVGYYKIATINHVSWNFCDFCMLLKNSYIGTTYSTILNCSCADSGTELKSFTLNIITGTNISDKLAYLYTYDSNNYLTKIEVFIHATRFEHPMCYIINARTGQQLVIPTQDEFNKATPDKPDGTTMTGYATTDNRRLLNYDLGVTIENTTTDKGWKMFNPTYTGYLLQSVRFNANSPAWGVGDYGSGIVFGGDDTKGVLSLSWRLAQIKFAGGNSGNGGPVWWIGLNGTSTTTYDLDRLKYTPTTAGTSGYSLKSSGGSNAPRWANSRSVAISGTVSTGAKACVAASAMITSGGTDNELDKGLWYYVGTYGVFIVFVPTAITTPYSARTIYITGYVSSKMSGSITLVEL